MVVSGGGFLVILCLTKLFVVLGLWLRWGWAVTTPNFLLCGVGVVVELGLGCDN